MSVHSHIRYQPVEGRDEDVSEDEDIESVGTVTIQHVSMVTSVSKSHQAAILALLIIQGTANSLCIYNSRAVLGETWTSGSALCAAEFVKFVISFLAVWRELASQDTKWHEMLSYNFSLNSLLPMSVPAIVYVIQNMLNFYSLLYIEPGLFTIMAQMKLTFTALAAYGVLGARLSYRQISDLVLVLLGTVGVTAATNDFGVENTHLHEFFLGMICSQLSCALSGLNTVYLEKILKASTSNRQNSLWEKNMQLGFISIPVYLSVECVRAQRIITSDFWNGWTPNTLLVVLVQAGGGLLVALTLKYAGSIAKALSGTGSIILTAYLQSVFFDRVMSIHGVISTLVVSISVFNFKRN